MQQWTDLFLNMPLPEGWMRGLLFVTFGLHLLFVLLMLGNSGTEPAVFFARSFYVSHRPSSTGTNTSLIRTWGSRAWL